MPRVPLSLHEVLPKKPTPNRVPEGFPSSHHSPLVPGSHQSQQSHSLLDLSPCCWQHFHWWKSQQGCARLVHPGFPSAECNSQAGCHSRSVQFILSFRCIFSISSFFPFPSSLNQILTLQIIFPAYGFQKCKRTVTLRGNIEDKMNEILSHSWIL